MKFKEYLKTENEKIFSHFIGKFNDCITGGSDSFSSLLDKLCI